MFDHLTTLEIREHVARLEAAMRRGSSMAYPLDQIASDSREAAALRAELRERRARVYAS